MDKRLKRRIAVGAVAGFAIAGAGGAIAATQLGSPQDTSKAIVEDAAKQLGIEPSKLSNALKKALENQVDAAVTDGRLTKEEGDALKKRIESSDAPLLFGPLLGRGHGFGFGFGFGHGPGFRFHVDLSTAASYLGLTEAELRTQLESGKSLAQIAKDKGKSVDGLVQALYDAAKKKLDAEVAAGRLTKEREEAVLGDLKQRLTDVVNNTPPRLGPWLGFGFRHIGDLSAAASYLGLTEAELRTQLGSGKSLAQIAKDKGKSVDGLVQALYDAAKKKLDAEVAAGRLTKEKEATILSNLKEALTDLVNRTPPKLGDRGFGFGDHFRGRAFGDRMMAPGPMMIPGRFRDRMPGRFGGAFVSPDGYAAPTI